MVPCPIADDGDLARALPEYNAAVVRSINYFVVENLRTGRRFLSRVGMGRPIDTLKLERERLYADLVEVNRALRDLKSELHLCEQIEADSTHIHENLQPFLTEDRELRPEFAAYEEER